MSEEVRSTVSTPPASEPLQAFQDLLDRLVVAMTLIGLPAVLIAMARAAEFGWRWGVSVQAAAWGLVVVLVVFRRRLTFRRRTYGFLAALMIYAGAGVVTWGLNGQGLLLLFACVVIATMVDGARAGLAATLFSLAIACVAGAGFVTGWMGLGPEAANYNRSMLGWATGVSTAAVVMLGAAWSLGRLKSSWLGIMKTLRDREEEYASILRFTPDIIYRLDVRNRITYVSDAVRRYGYDPEELRGRSLLDFVHPQERSAVAQRLQERRTGRRRTHNMEVRLFDRPTSIPESSPPDREDFGQPIFLVSAEGLYDAGRVHAALHRGTQGVARDITEYKYMYRELLREKILSETTINSLPGVFYLFSEAGHLENWNRHLETVTGYGPEDLRDRHILDFFPDDEQNMISERFREAMAQGSSSAEAHLISKTGCTIPYLFTGSALVMDGRRFLVGMGVDITERKRAETTLMESEKKYRFLAENIEDIIWTLDLDFNVTYISPAVEKILGWTTEEVQARGLDGVMPVATQKTFRRAFTRGYADSAAHNDFFRTLTLEQTLWHKEGHEVWVENTTSFLCGKDGQPCGLLGVTRDITQRRQALLEKEELQQKLERARKMEALGLLAGGVAHDLNNILTGIVSYPSLMLMKLPPDSPLRKNLTRMKASGEKAAEIVQDLLTLARRGVKTKEVLDINQVIREHLQSAEHFHLRAEHPGVRIISELAPDLMAIEGSPLHLKKALMNMITNACEAQPGGGSVTLQTQNRYIDRPLKGYQDVEKGAFVVVRVADEGPGMAPDEVDRIFEPFYTRKTMGRSGTGLGMAVVWGTIQDHQGYIHVKSAPGQGTRFDLYFPVTRRAALQTRPAPGLADLQGAGQTVLVVDDDPEQRAITLEILEALNYRGAAVDSGEAALEHLQAQAADLLVLDMIMPRGMDGLETYRAVLERHPRQKAVVVSGFAETARVQETLRLGATRFVRKPYNVETLAQAIQSALVGDGHP
jgi:two-component system cell cycle sensor histidine kinase/response regulator CckA